VTAHADVRPHRFQPWRTAAMGFCLTAVLGAAAMPAMASEPVRLGYRIYTGGFNVLDITIDLNIDPSAYRIDIGAETQGWIGKLLSWQSQSHSEGVLREGDPVPRTHRMSSVWRGEPRAVNLDYDGNGRVAFSAEPPADRDERDPVPAELTVNTLDPLSAVLGALTARQNGQVCTDTVPVFDGRRRYDMLFQPAGMVELKPSKYSLYAGPALRCQVRSKLIAGKWRRGGWQDESAGRPPIELMVASVAADLPPIPVRLEGESRYGDVVIHLASMERLPYTALTPDNRPGGVNGSRHPG
jgi:hypothetical protein